MATYHFSAKPIKRSAGRSAVGAAAYRAGVEITDERTGVVHDYTRKGGVLHSELILPGGGTADRAEFWNGIESHHKRGDAVLAREVEVSLPAELTAEQRKELAVGYARELADRYGVAADVALHAPRKITDRDLEKNPDQYHERDADGVRHNGNWHAHIMLSACSVQPDGTLGKKAVELDPIHCQKHRIENMVDRERARWGELANAALGRHGHQARIDHRSHAERGIEAEPTRHLGPAGAAIERRTGESSRRRQAFDQDIADRLTKAKELGALERERDELKASIIDLSGNLSGAIAQREAEERARKAREALAAAAKVEAPKPLDVAPMAPPIDYRAALIAEVERLTEGRAECFEKDGIRSTGTVFAVNERFAAQDTGRLRVRIMDRTQIPVALGQWTVEVSGSIKAGQLRDGGRGLQYIYGKGVTEQLMRAPAASLVSPVIHRGREF